MPRLPLIHIPNGLYSVVSKCNNKEFLFNTPEKFEMYIRHLLFCKKELGFKIYDIVCMSNHVHELYRVPEKVTIAQILQRVKGIFSQIYNKQFGRTGHFWHNKPFYRIIENEEYAYNTMNYFHWNPVRAGLAKSPNEWPYSGYQFHVLGKTDTIIGKLLDNLPYTPPTHASINVVRAVEKALKSKQMRYIGSLRFRRLMKNG